MPTLTVLTPGAETHVEAELVDDLALVDPSALPTALGWELKPEGLCRDDVCIPLRDDGGVRHGDRLDLLAVARAVGCATLLADDADVLAVSVAAADRRHALTGRQAPDFTLPDLEGKKHSLESFAGRKRLLVAFASW